MAVFLRALVMLVTLVGLPAAWVYFGPLPPGPQRVIDRFMDVARNALGLEQNAGACEQRNLGVAPRFQEEVPIDKQDEAPSFEGNTDVSGDSQISLVSAALPQKPAAATRIVESAHAHLAEELEPHLSLLRSLEAVDYKLEQWGATGKQYRFSCSIPLGTNDAFTRHFDAISTDPVAAVREVVGEITSWQNANQATCGAVQWR